MSEGANARFLVAAFDWLTLDENLVAVTANLPPVRELSLTDARRGYVVVLSLGLLPGVFLLCGALAWAARRHR